MRRDGTVIEDRFEAIPRGRKVRCKLCGRAGYPVNGGWRVTCSRDHLPCKDCGRQIAVKLDGTVRQHIGCPGRRDENT